MFETPRAVRSHPVNGSVGKWERLGPVHRSTGPVEMLSHIQKLYKIKHVTISQRSNALVHWTQAFP